MTWRLLASCLGLLAVAACAATGGPKFASYRYQGIDLLAGIDGQFVADPDCIKFVARSPARTVIAVLPQGTVASARGLRFPAANGGIFVGFNQPVAIQGGFNSLDPTQRHLENPTRCTGPAFVVNKVTLP